MTGPPVRNDSGETIPAFAAVRVTGVVEVKGRLVFTVEKPDDSDGPCLINGPHPVAAGSGETPSYGQAQPGPLVSGYFDTADSPAVGDELGPEDGAWKLGAGGSGWTFLGSLGSDAVGLFREAVGGARMLLAMTTASHGPGVTLPVNLCDDSFVEYSPVRPVDAKNDSGVTIPNDTRLYVMRFQGVYRIVQAFTCSDPPEA